MSDGLAVARILLAQHFGFADFRPAQAAVIRSVLAGHDTLAILPTGGGKSVCFQVPALVFGGLTVVVSPLIALMQDQVAAACARGIPARGLHSALDANEVGALWEDLRRGAVRLLYLSPERLSSVAPLLTEQGIRPVLLAVDEAHCVTEWGHDFRPSYRTLGASRYRLGRPPSLALTGSATPAVRADIAAVLRFRRNATATHLGSFDRPNLWFGVVPVPDDRGRLRALRSLLVGDDRMAIVYAPTRGLTEAIAGALVRAGHRAVPYHAGLTKARRADTLRRFLDDDLDVVVATCAFGMGIDKPDVRLVLHWTMPPTPEAYYQEAGRAGRDGALARCVLLWRRGDGDLHRRQLSVTFPPREVLTRLWSAGAAGHGIPANVRQSAERLRRELRPESGRVDWNAVDLRRRNAERRIAAMERYATAAACRRRVLLDYFGERLARCAGCDRCPATIGLPRPASAAVRARRSALEAAVGGRGSPWGWALLEPEVIERLAEHPPATAAALADVPGIGPALAQSLGGILLSALGTASRPSEPDRQTSDLVSVLANWRRRVAVEMGVPDYLVLGDVALAALASGSVKDRRALARLPGVGPRTLAKFGARLLTLVGAGSAPDEPP